MNPAHCAAVGTTPRTGTKDAVAWLKSEHETVLGLLAEYRDTRSVANKRALVAEICTALHLHGQVQEDVLLPDTRSLFEDRPGAPEVRFDRAGIERLMAEIEGREPDGAAFDAKVMLLSACFRQYLRQARVSLFPALRASSLDLFVLGARLAARKAVLRAEAARSKAGAVTGPVSLASR